MKFKINLNIFLLLILLTITNQFKMYILIMIFTLLHEMIHIFCGIILGFKIDTFKIIPFGFCIELKNNIEDFNKKVLKSNILAIKKIIVALSGPLFNLLIVIFGIKYNIKIDIIYMNFLIFLFNIIPIYPLDGGRILKNIFKLLYGNRKANKYINNISNVFMIVLTIISSIVILIYKNISIVIVLMVLWEITIKENAKYNTYKKVYKTIDKTCNYL